MSKIIKLVRSEKEQRDSSKEKTQRILLTCQSGLESLVRRECEKLGFQGIQVQDRLVQCSGTSKNLYEILICSRFANRVYLELGEQHITDFDGIFDLCKTIPWKAYLTGSEKVVIEASSTRSQLSSIPTLQSVAQRAIFEQIKRGATTSGPEVHILVLLIDDQAHILLDITGNPLHKRGYRVEAGIAPIKENLAAGLVAFSGWKYRESLEDPFCGSGTIAIEAAMIARNIAPGLHRHFRIEDLHFFDENLFEQVKHEAREKFYPSGKYHIFASDQDESLVRIAQENAKRAGVEADIQFEVKNFLETKNTHCIVTNPPYGDRMTDVHLDDIYKKLLIDIEKNGGGCITNFPIEKTHLANKKLLNGGEECRFWYKKSR